MKTVIITGASRGIGLATAHLFAEKNYNIVLNSLHNDNNLSLALSSCLNAGNGTCIAVPGDAGDPAFADKLVSSAFEAFGSVDIMINNAGISFVGLIQDTDNAAWDRIISTNLSSVHYLTRACIPYMLKKHAGSIINISSVWGVFGGACEAAYSASKGGVNAYTKACAKELAPSGIAVNAIACGCVDTDMMKCFSEDDIKALNEQIPVGRPANAEEIAEIVYHLSMMPGYLTGQVITADGGWM